MEQLVILLIVGVFYVLSAIYKAIRKVAEDAKSAWNGENALPSYRPTPLDETGSPQFGQAPPAATPQHRPAALLNIQDELRRQLEAEFGIERPRPEPAPMKAQLGSSVTQPQMALATDVQQGFTVTTVAASRPIAPPPTAAPIRSADQEWMSADTAPIVAPIAVAQPVTALSNMLGNRDQWVRAIVLQEVLGPPLARRRRSSGPPHGH
jgi:hypothetical protein